MVLYYVLHLLVVFAIYMYVSPSRVVDDIRSVMFNPQTEAKKEDGQNCSMLCCV